MTRHEIDSAETTSAPEVTIPMSSLVAFQAERAREIKSRWQALRALVEGGVAGPADIIEEDGETQTIDQLTRQLKGERIGNDALFAYMATFSSDATGNLDPDDPQLSAEIEEPPYPSDDPAA